MDNDKFTVTFWGVRGGYPMPGPTTVKYGGNTTCIEICAGEQRIIIDGGTGLIKLGGKMMQEHFTTGRPIHATLLITHTHHDHTQGFPFFVPTRHPACTLHIYGQMLGPEKLETVLDRAMSPPVFPLGTEELASRRTLDYVRTGDILILPAWGAPPEQYHLGEDPGAIPPDAVQIDVAHGYNHPQSGILIFRITYHGRRVIVATDTEGYIGGDRKLIEFARGADLLIHDAEYTEEEYLGPPLVRQGWGHSTWRMAAEVGEAAGVKLLALTHHHPGHTDADLEKMLAQAQTLFPRILLAREGETIEIK